MLDFAKIDRLTESDFTGIFKAAGGSRFSNDDSKEDMPNADYVINDVIVELKLVEEEGFDKTARQQKLSKLFVKYDKSPVVVIDPDLLSDEKSTGPGLALCIVSLFKREKFKLAGALSFLSIPAETTKRRSCTPLLCGDV